MRRNAEKRNRKAKGFTLVELMVSLSIFTVASLAMSSLMFATYNTNRHVQSMADGSSKAEIALRRMVEIVRSSVLATYDAPTKTWMFTTPTDSAKNLQYEYLYYTAVNATTGDTELHETVETVGANVTPPDYVLIDNLTTDINDPTHPPFSITDLGTVPRSYRVTLTVRGTPLNVTRTATVTVRNIKS